ncbi:MAG: hemerythrin domain-containing protein [Acidiferrobacter sp.]
MDSQLIESFTHHHRALDNTFAEARSAAEDGDFARASQALQAFREALERHMGAEETWLFPAYEAQHGPDNAMTAILRKGHRDLRGFFEEIAEALEQAEGEEAVALIGTVGQILQHHDEKEEQEFYPAVAPLLKDAGPAIKALGA